MNVQIQLVFSLPSEEQALYLYENREAYLEYKMCLAYVSEYLVNFVPVYSRPDVTPGEAMNYIEEAIRHPAIEPVRAYLENIRATLIRLKAEYEIDPDTGKQLMRHYLDESLALSARFSHAKREQNFEIVRAYLQEQYQDNS